MSKTTLTYAASVAMACGLATAAQADDVLTIDLTVLDQITISATDGLSAASVSGPSFTGVYLDGFYNGPGANPIDPLVAGDLTTFLNPSDGSPALFRGVDDPGLNFWNFSTDGTVSFSAGVQAFAGSGTWDLDHESYLQMLEGNTSGNVYFPADTVDDVPAATLIGTYTVIPAPAALGVLGLAGVAGLRRRR